MSDLNVTAHGINPETGEYLSPAERKALFKKQRMKSKIDPGAFRSGVSTAKKTSDTKDLPGGTGGGGIVKFNIRDVATAGSSIIKLDDIKPQEDQEPVQKVKVEDLGPTESSEDKNSQFKDSLKELLESFKKILNLKEKQKNIKSKVTELGKKLTPKKGPKKKKSKIGGTDVLGIGRKIKSATTKVFGDIFGMFGDILQFAVLDWISKPENKEKIKTIVKVAGEIFKWIDKVVTFGIDTALTGISELVTPGNSITQRLGGFLKILGVLIGLRWLTNPFKIIKDLRGAIKFVKGFGKFANKLLSKPFKFIQNFVRKFISKGFSSVFKGKIFKPIRRFILKIGGKSALKLLGVFGRSMTKFISRIPVLGGLLDFALNVFVFKENPGRAAFKAIGATLLGALGLILGPVGAVLGGFTGDWAGGKIYDVFFGGQPATGYTPPTKEELVAQTERGSGMASFREDSAENAALQESVRSGNASGSKTGSVKALLNTIRYAEGTAGPNGYNTWFGGRTDMDLTSMTINEVVAEQKRRLASGEATYGKYTSAAVGAYQMMEPEKSAAAIGINPATTKFTPEIQDRIAVDYYMKKQARMSQAEIEAPISKAQIAKISGVWASLPDAVGNSAYGQPVKKYKKLETVYNQSRANAKGTGRATKITPPPKKSKARNLRPSKPAASAMPAMSVTYMSNKKFRRRSATVPIIVNSMNNATMNTTITSLPLNSTSISDNSVFNKI